MEIIDHGTWDTYQPANPPRDAPRKAKFAKRNINGVDVDWYDYVYPDFMRLHAIVRPTFHPDTGAPLPPPVIPPSNFKAGSLVCNVFYSEYNEGYVIGNATDDPTAVYPNDQRVIEVVGYTGSDPLKDISGKMYDHATKSLKNKPPPREPLPSFTEQKILNVLDKVLERLEKLEKHPHK
jgi:hypothetical protein